MGNCCAMGAGSAIIDASAPLTSTRISSSGPTSDQKLTGFKTDLVALGSMIASSRAVSVPESPKTLDD